MTKEEAKRVIREDQTGNIWERIEAIMIAEKDLGENYTTADLYKWAEDTNEQNNKV